MVVGGWRVLRLAAALALCVPPAAAPVSPPSPPSPAASRAAPCAASPLCHCATDHFTCDAVPFHRFPETEAGVRHVSVWGARLGALEEAALDARALHTLVLVACRLDALQPAALASMKSTLASLDLGHNEFTEVPFLALRDLKVLNWLNLQNNFISDLDNSAGWGALAESLTSLSLSNNRLTILRANALASLRALTQLELDGNRLSALEPKALPHGLVLLRLSDNLLPAPPCATLAALPRLAHLALRDNMLSLPVPSACHPPSTAATVAHLHTLDLAHNSLTDDFLLHLGIRLQLKHLILDLNDLTALPTFVIECGRLEKLSVSHNRLAVLSEVVLGALSRDLRQLELDYNELTALPSAMRNLGRLRRLSVAYNRLREVLTLPPRLYALSLAGNALVEFPKGLRDLAPRTLVHLDLGYNRIAHVSAAAFGEWATALDTLSLRGNRLSVLSADAFPALPLRELALSFNDLFVVEEGALTVLRELHVLELAGALAGGTVPRVPPSLTWLALDNNDIHRVTSGDLLAHPQLEYLNMDFNKIVSFPSDAYWGNVSSGLKELRLAYNYVNSLNGEFLSTLSNLQSIDLSYNRMRNVSERSFSNLNNLVFVGLAGNAIECLCAGAFRALPRLQTLELQDNHLLRLATEAFEEVSSEDTNFLLNVSHNRIATLAGGGSVPIGVLDLSYNALESLPAAFFEGVAAHLRRLLLSHNRLAILDGLGAYTLPRLAVLSLRDNELEALRRRVLAAAPALQDLDLARNRLTTLAPDQFCTLRRLRTLRLAGNQLRAVPPGALAGTMLEALDLRDNHLGVPPTAAVSRVGFTLRHLELAGNDLRRLDAAALAGVGFLRELSLARTALRVLPDAALAGLGRLRRLDLSQNALVANYRELLHPVPRLRHLALAGVGLRAVPSLPLPALHELDLSGNAISACREAEVHALTELRALNLSHNRLTSLQPAAWAALPQLAVLDVSNNPLVRVPSGAFDGLPRLLRLRMNGLHALETLEPRALRPLRALRSLELDAGHGTVPGAALAMVPHVQALMLHARVQTLDEQLGGLDAAKLRAVEVRGAALRRLTARALAPLGRARALALRLRGTSVAALPSGLPARLARVSQLALELSGNALVALAPAALYPNLTGWNRRATKLLSGGLVVQEPTLRCGCGASWLGAWLRRWTREVGGGARDAQLTARRSWCTAGAARRALLALEADAAECHASALSARAPPRWPAPAPLCALALLLLGS